MRPTSRAPRLGPAGGGPGGPAPPPLPVTGEIAAGDIGAHRLVPGTAIRIMTGARLPAGADAVVPVEWTDGGRAQVEIHRPAEPGSAIRYVGGDAAEGETLLTAGTRLRPMQVARRSRSAPGPGSWCCPPATS
jgi:molybdopterin biosynthesis enzyme